VGSITGIPAPSAGRLDGRLDCALLHWRRAIWYAHKYNWLSEGKIIQSFFKERRNHVLRRIEVRNHAIGQGADRQYTLWRLAEHKFGVISHR